MDKKPFEILHDLRNAVDEIKKTMASKDDLKRFATKVDLKEFIMKDDLAAVEGRLAARIAELPTKEFTEELFRDVFQATDKHKAEKSDVEEIKLRVKTLERKAFPS
jgi:hypothetical protein